MSSHTSDNYKQNETQVFIFGDEERIVVDFYDISRGVAKEICTQVVKADEAIYSMIMNSKTPAQEAYELLK